MSSQPNERKTLDSRLDHPEDRAFDRFLDQVETWLGSVGVRIALSLLILVSVLPATALGSLAQWVESQGRWLFLPVFGSELLLRSMLFARRWRRRRLQGGELLFLVLDALAVLSFLPLPLDAESFRLLRLGRLLVLIGYWRGLGRDLWSLLMRPERRFQVLAVLFLGLLLALTSAILLIELGARYDFNTDGTIDEQDADFLQVLWWGLRQVQDPGNLVPEVYSGTLLAISIALTLSGLLLFSFLIGIGTTVVEELVELSRSRRVGLRGHTVVLGLTQHTVILLSGLAELYRKNLRPYSGAVLADSERPDSLDLPLLRGFRYRRGLPSRTDDLDRVDISKAKRVIVLGDDSVDPDAGVLSAILATRKRNPTVDLFPDIEHERNFPAVRAAGGRGTHLVGSGPFLGYYLAQNIAHPGIHRLYRHLLQSTGSEVYTYVFSTEERRRLRQVGQPGGWLTPTELHLQAAAAGVTLLGVFTYPDPDAEPEVEDFDRFLNPVRRAGRGQPHPALDAAGKLRGEAVRGLIGIALRFSTIGRLATELLEHGGGETNAKIAPNDPRKPSIRRTDTTSRATPFDTLHLHPARWPVRRVLILGAGPRAPRLIRELVGFFGRLEGTVLARVDEPWQALVHDTRTMLGDTFGSDPLLEANRDDTVLRLRLERPERHAGERRGHALDARLTFMEADWTHRHRLEAEGAVTLSEADVVVFLPGGDRRSDSDGAIALDLLHLANLERTGDLRLAKGVHVVALVRDPDKGRLLEQRLAGLSADSDTRYTVIARETARHRFVMQSVFVHGLNSIYLDLLSSKGQYLSRLLPHEGDGRPACGAFVPRQLAAELLARRGLVLVGFEWLDEHGQAETRVEPAVVQALEPLPWQRIAALYVLGDGDDLDAAG